MGVEKSMGDGSGGRTNQQGEQTVVHSEVEGDQTAREQHGDTKAEKPMRSLQNMRLKDDEKTVLLQEEAAWCPSLFTCR